MKFRIERTSDFLKETPPCEGAYLDGKDCEWGNNKWAIDVNSLEDLMKLAEIDGRIVVFAPHKDTDNYPAIEIYDDYRE